MNELTDSGANRLGCICWRLFRSRGIVDEWSSLSVVGLDTSAFSVVIAIAFEGMNEPGRLEGLLGADPGATGGADPFLWRTMAEDRAAPPSGGITWAHQYQNNII